MSRKMISTTLTTSQVTTGTAAQVLAANPSRLGLVLKNADATNAIAIGSSSSVTALNGFVLKGGEQLIMETYAGPVFAIAVASTPILMIATW